MFNKIFIFMACIMFLFVSTVIAITKEECNNKDSQFKTIEGSYMGLNNDFIGMSFRIKKDKTGEIVRLQLQTLSLPDLGNEGNKIEVTYEEKYFFDERSGECKKENIYLYSKYIK